jgi:uncharacterized protein
MTRTDMSIKPEAGVASGKPWGAWTTVAWVVAAIAPQLLFVFWIVHSPLRHSINPVLDLLLWAISPVVLVVAVLIRRLSVAAYLAWTAPRASDVIIAVGAALVCCLGFSVLVYVVSGGTSIGINSDAYRQYLAAGGTPSGYLLRSYQSYLYAPFIEETVFRGFLWRGVAASRIGNWGAWLLTSAFFAASPAIYYADPGALIQVAISGLVFGLVRWRTRSTTASMITHFIYNRWGEAGAVLAVTVGWP